MISVAINRLNGKHNYDLLGIGFFMSFSHFYTLFQQHQLEKSGTGPRLRHVEISSSMFCDLAPLTSCLLLYTQVNNINIALYYSAVQVLSQNKFFETRWQFYRKGSSVVDRSMDYEHLLPRRIKRRRLVINFI